MKRSKKWNICYILLIAILFLQVIYLQCWFHTTQQQRKYHLYQSSTTSPQRTAILFFGTLDDEFAMLSKLSLLNRLFFCFRYHYDCIIYTEPAFYFWERRTAWSKIAYLQTHLKNYDWMVWVDTDALIMNMNRNQIPQLIHDISNEKNRTTLLGKEPAHILIAKDGYAGINSGVFLIKNTPWTQQVVQNVLSWKYIHYSYHFYMEQVPFSTEISVNEKEVHSNVEIVAKKKLNAYQLDYIPGESFVTHQAGCPKSIYEIKTLPFVKKHCPKNLEEWFAVWFAEEVLASEESKKVFEQIVEIPSVRQFLKQGLIEKDLAIFKKYNIHL